MTGFQPEGCCGGFAADFKKGGGAAGAAGYVEGLCSLRSGGDSPDGLRVVVAASPQIIKVSVTELAFYIIWHEKHSGD
mgnify:CR=1 FL=1